MTARPRRAAGPTSRWLRCIAALSLPGALWLAGCRSSTGSGFDFERMVRQDRYDAYEPSALFPDGKAMRTPPDGTFPYEPDPLPAVIRTGRRGGEPVVLSPVPMTLDVLRRGRDRFGVYCSPCHGLDGFAGTPIAGAMELQPPPALYAPFIRAMADGTLYDVIRNGYGLMPGYEVQLPPLDRWAVVAYVRALQLGQALSLDALPPAVRDSVVARLPERSP